MEDVTNLAFRLICKEIANPGLMFTEFVSAMAIHFNPDRTIQKMRVHPSELPLGIQIFGSEPDKMAEAAKVAEGMGADLVDINMGCWVPKVCRTGAGAALLRDPKVAVEVVRAVVGAVSVPVTVKVRAGFEHGVFTAPDLARQLEDCGIAMMTLHARFARQGFDGEADWGLIEGLRRVLSIPLVGNGDIKTADDAKRMIDSTGCDGVMVGRAAISDPWCLARIRAGLAGDPVPGPPRLDERAEVALRHARLMVAHAGGVDTFEEAKASPGFAAHQVRGIRALRGQLPQYIKGAPGAPAIRGRLSQVSSVEELEEVLGKFVTEQGCLS